jgi:hypothetical protein
MTEQQEDFRKKDIFLDEEKLARIKAWNDEQNSPEAKRERRILKQKNKRQEKILNEVLTKPVTKARNRQLQKVLQHIEYYHGKHVRAMYTVDWLKYELERWRYDIYTEEQEQQFIERLIYLKKMSFRAGDVYEKWNQ